MVWYWALATNAQSPVCVELSHVGISQSELRSMQPINRFALLGDSIHEPLDLASASTADIPRQFAFVRPLNWNTELNRNSYFWVYNRRESSGPIEDHSLVLVQEQLYQGRMIRVYWVDSIGNLDFEQVKGDTLWNLFTPWKLKLGPGLSVLMEPFPVTRFSAFAQMHDASVHSLSGPRVYMGSASAFRYQRLNLRWGTYEVDSSKQVYMAVIDQNFNGQYGDKGIDKVLISMDSSYFDDENAIAWNARTATVSTVWRGRPWELSISGSQVCVKVEEDGDHPLIQGKKLPRVRYQLVDAGLYSPQKMGLHRNWRVYRKQQLWVYAWQPDMGLNTSDSVILANFAKKQFSAWRDLTIGYRHEHDGEDPPLREIRKWFRDPQSILNIRIMMLAQGGNTRYVQTLNRRFGFSFDQLVMDNRAARKMKWQSLPQVLKIDACGRIVDADANLQVLTGLLTR